jgi:FMN phosphatase YigB (HAD superfamily)
MAMLKYVVLDFDGTCTLVDRALSDQFLTRYRDFVFAEPCLHGLDLRAAWDRTEAFVRAQSPRLAWRLGVWETCPAAPDPFILASATAELMLEEQGLLDIVAVPAADGQSAVKLRDRMYHWYGDAYAACEAAPRPELTQVLTGLLDLGLTVRFVSNSGQGKVQAYLNRHLPAEVMAQVQVFGDARKFCVRVATTQGEQLPLFQAMPSQETLVDLPRPVLLKRGSYFDVLQGRVWQERDAPERTLVCGDIYELDLAMPAWLGSHVHLVQRPEPFRTHDYELAAVRSHARGGTSPDLMGLLERARSCVAVPAR